ncbi:hypothetical protein F5880DRAFT_1607894 [Lentinula raphanica]|nr:hypothetical protein F5880DRAFT_1607894 [Lentinula raphanica]
MANTAKTAPLKRGGSITDYFTRKLPKQSPPGNSENQAKLPERQQRTIAKTVASSSPTKPAHKAPSPEKRCQTRSESPCPIVRSKDASLSQTSPEQPLGKRKTRLGVGTTLETGKSLKSPCKAGSTPLKSDMIAVPPDIVAPPTPLSPYPSPDAMKRNKPQRKESLPPSESISMDEVPGSVSGEEEMDCVSRVRRDAGSGTQESVAKWRNESSNSLFDDPEDMDVDEIAPSKSETELSLFRTTPSPSRQQPTPPPTTTSQQTMTMLPPPPTAIETAKKTENMIAEIKARALAAAKASQKEEETRTFKETLSDSDSDDDLRPLEISVKGKGKAKEAVAPAKTTTAYYNTRSTNARPQPKTVSPTVLQSERRKAAPKKHNPIAALVKETREEKRSGRGEIDFLKAAQRVLPEDQGLLDLDDEDDLDSLGSPSQKRSFLSGNEIDALRADLAAGDRRRLFGDQSEGIKNILDSDSRIIKAEERRNIEVGVQFWTDDALSVDEDVDMDVEPTLDFGDCSQFPVLRQLHHALNSEDYSSAIAILDSGLLNTIDLKGFPGVTSYLTFLALSSPTNEDLSASAFNALRNVWLASRLSGSGITLRSVLDAVSRLGAKSKGLKLSGRKAAKLDHQRKESLIFRLVKLIESSALPRLLNMDEIPELMLVLLAISLDPSTSNAVQTAILVAVDAVLQSVADPNVVAHIEPVICNKILVYIQEFEPCNVSRIVTFLIGSPGRSTRIARWVARSVLLKKRRITQSEYCHSPSVQDLSEILIEGAKTPCQVFQINHDTDYIELGHYVQILAVALTDISSYFPSEIAAAAAAKAEQSSVHSSPSKDKTETPLEYLHRCMTFVQQRITDSGTDIERSRTKAALQQLSMRLYFQLAARKSEKSPTINAYFERRKPGGKR